MSPEGTKGLQTKPSRRVLDLTADDADLRRYHACHLCHLCYLWLTVVNCGHLCHLCHLWLTTSARVSLLRPMKLAIGRNLIAASIAYRLQSKPCLQMLTDSGNQALKAQTITALNEESRNQPIYPGRRRCFA